MTDVTFSWIFPLQINTCRFRAVGTPYSTFGYTKVGFKLAQKRRPQTQLESQRGSTGSRKCNSFQKIASGWKIEFEEPIQVTSPTKLNWLKSKMTPYSFSWIVVWSEWDRKREFDRPLMPLQRQNALTGWGFIAANGLRLSIPMRQHLVIIKFWAEYPTRKDGRERAENMLEPNPS